MTPSSTYKIQIAPPDLLEAVPPLNGKTACRYRKRLEVDSVVLVEGLVLDQTHVVANRGQVARPLQ